MAAWSCWNSAWLTLASCAWKLFREVLSLADSGFMCLETDSETCRKRLSWKKLPPAEMALGLLCCSLPATGLCQEPPRSSHTQSRSPAGSLQSQT